MEQDSAGATAIGNTSLDGVIADLSAFVSVAGAGITFRHDEIAEGSGHILAVTLDGDIYEILPTSPDILRTSFPSTIGSGEHTADAHIIRPEARRIPDFHGLDYGKRAFLRWPASTSTDLRSYRINSNNGSGSVTADAFAVVSGSVIHRQWYAAGTGTGTGRITIRGEWLGEDVNASFQITTTGSTFTHNLSGSTSAAIAIVPRVPIPLINGVVIVFDDAVTAYASKTFAFRVGPPVELTTQALEEGTWKFTVRAVDGAGNVSAAIGEATVPIIHRPLPVSDLSASWDGTDITIAWTLPGETLEEVRIFSNYSNTFNRLGERILTDYPWEVVADDAEAFSFTPDVAGIYRFQVRTVDTAGRVSDSIATVEVDTTAVPTGLLLNLPEQVTVTPSAGGTMIVSWIYPIADGTDVDEFNIYANTDPEDLDFTTPLATVTAEPSGAAELLQLYTHTTGVLSVPTYFTVRAVAGVIETLNVDIHLGTPDATAPTLSGSTEGLPN
jgi:hypothetical protein